MVGGTLITRRKPSAHTRPANHEAVYRCECGHALWVFGGGRHRVYFEPGNSRLDNPVMDGACPQCGRGLPGKSRM